jgi:hypothetical protein
MDGAKTRAWTGYEFDQMADQQGFVVLYPDGHNSLVTNAGLNELIARLRNFGVAAAIAVEATGGFERIVAAGLASANLPVVVVNPAQVRDFAKALGKRAKTDPIDALVIARFVEAMKPPLRPMPDEATQLLADLVARRRQIVQLIGAESQREKRAWDKWLKKSMARVKSALENELAEIDGQIDATFRKSPAWMEKAELLQIGPRHRPRHRPRHSAYLAGGNARAGHAWWPRRRRACGTCAMDAPVRSMERQELHQRRAQDVLVEISRRYMSKAASRTSAISRRPHPKTPCSSSDTSGLRVCGH